jgi:hypothetical protein
MVSEPMVPQYLFLKDDRAAKKLIVTVTKKGADEEFNRIRCPLCAWQPTPSSRWCCEVGGTPEPFFEGCGMIWNTFSTRGRCPRCSHQWRWTSCLRCHRASLHNDWYEQRGRPGPAPGA